MLRLFAERSALASFVMMSASLAAHETRVGEAGFESPPASVEQLDWLVGAWEGEGIGTAPALESWLPPIGGTMVGTFVQQTDDGSIMFTEHMYIVPQGESLALKVKHFNADLTGWEEKDDMLTFRLVAMEPCAAYFNALTLRCADADAPGAGLVAAVRMKSDKPEPKELVFNFRAAKPAARSYDCDGTTIAINNCLAEIRGRAELRHVRYFEAALASVGDNAALADMIREGDVAFNLYANRECSALYEAWKEGSIRNAMTLRCSIRLIDQRTRDIWRNWLTYQDTSVPILPEPGPSR